MIQEVNYTQIKQNEDEFSKFIALCVVVKFEDKLFSPPGEPRHSSTNPLIK